MKKIGLAIENWYLSYCTHHQTIANTFPVQKALKLFILHRRVFDPVSSTSDGVVFAKIDNCYNYHCTQKKFPINDFISKCDQIRRKLLKVKRGTLIKQIENSQFYDFKGDEAFYCLVAFGIASMHEKWY